MLVVDRNLHESIIIPLWDDLQIEFKILGLSEHKIRLGINAPKELAIWRKELYAKILREQTKKLIGKSEVENGNRS